jgi:F0F1-type ATP synthase delta subunit
MTNLSLKRIVETIYVLTQGKTGKDLDVSVNNIVRFLARKRLLAKSAKILNMFSDYANKQEKIVPVKITYRDVPSVLKIKELEEILKKRYQAEQIRLDIVSDEKVFGGLKIEGMGEVIDLTLKNKLKLLQNYLLTN